MFVVGADDDTIRVLEIFDCRALAQELRIGHHAKVRIGPQLANDGVDLFVGSDRNRRFNGDDGEVVDFGGNLTRRVMDV